MERSLREYMSLDPWEAVIAMINDNYTLALNPVRTKLVSMEPFGADLRITLLSERSPSEGNLLPPFDQKTFQYTRLELGEFFGLGLDPFVFNLQAYPSSTKAVTQVLTAQTGVIFGRNDIEHYSIDAPISGVFGINAHPMSLRWVGSLSVTLGDASMGELRDFIPNRVLEPLAFPSFTVAPPTRPGDPNKSTIVQLVDALNRLNASTLPTPLLPEWFSLTEIVPIESTADVNTKATLTMVVPHAMYRGSALINYNRLPLSQVYAGVVQPLYIAGGPGPLVIGHDALGAAIDLQHPFGLSSELEPAFETLTTSWRPVNLQARADSNRFVGDLTVDARMYYALPPVYDLNAAVSVVTPTDTGVMVVNDAVIGRGEIRYWVGDTAAVPTDKLLLKAGDGALHLGSGYYLTVTGDSNGVSALVHPTPVAYETLALDIAFHAWLDTNPIESIDLLSESGVVLTKLTPPNNTSIYDLGTSQGALLLTDYNYRFRGTKVIGVTLGYREWLSNPRLGARIRINYRP